MAADELTSRPLVAADLAAVGGLFTRHTGRSPDLETFGRWIELHPSAGVVVEGVLVGFLVTCRFAPDVLEITNVLVDTAHQGQGIARLLLGDVEAEAIGRGFRALIVAPSELNVTQRERADAARFYGRLGFDTVHETPHTRIVVKTLAAP